MRRQTLLVIDDDTSLRYSIRKSLESDKLRVIEAGAASAGLELLSSDPPDVVLLDLRLNDASGVDVLREIRRLDGEVPVIMFTAFSTTSSTIEATKHGAFDYLLKPVDLGKLTAAIDRALASRVGLTPGPAHELRTFRPGVDVNMIGTSPAMQEVYKQIGRFAPTNGNVLILGESGTGKELAARAIHHHSRRRSGQYLTINCAALSETLLESELFGHEKGAFTGADKRRIGKFEYASGGTIFLDEVADMSAVTQAKLLRLLQEQRFERLGGNESIETDVRIIAATNKNLETMVAQGKFREDLLFRLNVFCIHLPPLRDRKEDIPELVSYFTSCFKEEFGKDRIEIDPEVFPLLAQYDWRGNMRELQSAVKYALAHTVGTVVRPSYMPPAVLASVIEGRRTPGASRHPRQSQVSLEGLTDRLLAEGSRNVYGTVLAHLEQIVLPRVLERTKGNLQQACEHLGISRNTLKAKMREHGIRLEHSILSKVDTAFQIVKPLD